MVVVRFFLQRISTLAAAIGLAAWVIGTLTMWLSGNAEMFQRMGALGVAASVLFFTDRLAQVELGRQRSVEKLLHEIGLELSALQRGVDPKDMPDQGYVVDLLTEERNFDDLRQKAEAFNFANVMLMTAATVQWGFGDRMVNKLVVCGSVQC